jgi:hypothetical protein
LTPVLGNASIPSPSRWPVWIVDTPVNRAAAESHWRQQPDIDPIDSFRDMLERDRDRLGAERDLLEHGRDRFGADRDLLEHGRDRLEGARDPLGADRDLREAGRDPIGFDRGTLNASYISITEGDRQHRHPAGRKPRQSALSPAWRTAEEKAGAPTFLP